MRDGCLLSRHQAPTNVGPARAEFIGDRGWCSAFAHLVEPVKLAPRLIRQENGRLTPSECRDREQAERNHHARTLHARMIRKKVEAARGRGVLSWRGTKRCWEPRRQSLASAHCSGENRCALARRGSFGWRVRLWHRRRSPRHHMQRCSKNSAPAQRVNGAPEEREACDRGVCSVVSRGSKEADMRFLFRPPLSTSSRQEVRSKACESSRLFARFCVERNPAHNALRTWLFLVASQRSRSFLQCGCGVCFSAAPTYF